MSYVVYNSEIFLVEKNILDELGLNRGQIVDGIIVRKILEKKS